MKGKTRFNQKEEKSHAKYHLLNISVGRRREIKYQVGKVKEAMAPSFR